MATKTYFKHKQCSTAPVTVYAWRLPSGAIFVAEDFRNPRLQKYFRNEHLDRVINPYKTDFQKILALAQWSSAQFSASSPFPHYPPWDGQVILDRIRHGKTGGFCAQYAFVFGQACQSAGFIPRYLDLASPENPGGHFTTEVYVPSLRKWVVFEAEWGIYYADEKGAPLSALDLHEWAIGKRHDAFHEVPQKIHSDLSWARMFYYFRYYLRNNFLSVPVYVRHEAEQMGFEPYRLIWKDSYTTINAQFLSEAIASADMRDFQYTLQTDSVPEVTWKKSGDFYKTLTSTPLYQMCKISIPRNVLIRLIKNDFVHDPAFHRLKA